MTDKTKAWKDFWAQQCAGKSAPRCLPASWQSVFGVLESRWCAFAGELADNAEVLDLATGDARVLRWLGDTKPGLVRIGIDLSPNLPPAPPGIEVRTGVAMEDLPFDDGRFDAVVSQFGVEYGDTPSVAAEIGRVTKEGARIAFVVHRGDGAILKHNLGRAQQIRWVIDEADLIGATKQAIGREDRPWNAATQAAADMAAEGRTRFGDNAAGWEIPEAVRRTLIMGARAQDSVDGVGSMLDRIAEEARNELVRIGALEGACATVDARQTFLPTFEKAGLKLADSEELHDAAGRLFAEMLHFERG